MELIEGPRGVTDMRSLGDMLHESVLKRAIRALCPDVHFDMGGKLNKYHPRIDEWQGVFYNGDHLCSMDRGVVPEYDVWHMNDDGERTHILRIGWRGTLQTLVNKRLGRLTWENLCVGLGIEEKKHDGVSLLASEVA